MAASAATYTTINSGDWSNPANWAGGSVPTTNPINNADTVNIRHVIDFDLATNINNHGELRIEPGPAGGVAQLRVPTNVTLDNFATGEVYVINGRLLQCRFNDCDDGQPYTGTNPENNQQNGVWANKGGYVEIRFAVVEVAQKWINESGGTRRIIDSCVFTGQDYQVSDSTEEITRSLVSIAWHGSGNFQTSGSSTITYDAAVIQIAGASGSFQQASSVTHSGDIDYIYLRNNVGNFIGTGEIKNDSGMPGGPVNLDAYCAQSTSKYIPNGEFTLPSGTAPNCGIAVGCAQLVPTAANALVEGRVMAADGRGIYGAVITVEGGGLGQPVLTRTNPFGYFSIELESGNTYLLTVSNKRYQFSNPTQVVTVLDSVTGIEFIADGLPTAPGKLDTGKQRIPRLR